MLYKGRNRRRNSISNGQFNARILQQQSPTERKTLMAEIGDKTYLLRVMFDENIYILKLL